MDFWCFGHVRVRRAEGAQGEESCPRLLFIEGGGNARVRIVPEITIFRMRRERKGVNRARDYDF